MKRLLIAVLFFSSFYAKAQSSNLEQAEATAKSGHKLILLTFSGSDWCIPCIRNERTVFENETFLQYANKNLVLVKADFPRLKKHLLPKDQQKQNEALAEKYNPNGAFPFTVLLTAEGSVVKQWDGDLAPSAQKFVEQLQTLQNGR